MEILWNSRTLRRKIEKNEHSQKYEKRNVKKNTILYLLRLSKHTPIKKVKAGSSTDIIISHNRNVCFNGNVREYNVRNHCGVYNSGGKSWFFKWIANSGSKYNNKIWNNLNALNKYEESSRHKCRSKYLNWNASNNK